MPDIALGHADLIALRDWKNPKPVELPTHEYEPLPLGYTMLGTRDDAIEAITRAMHMRKAGHAISWDDQYDCKGNFINASITHYLTCRCNLKGT